jgi:predicted RNA binding protein YcfA (HicA-like mRNA interferase family)
MADTGQRATHGYIQHEGADLAGCAPLCPVCGPLPVRSWPAATLKNRPLNKTTSELLTNTLTKLPMRYQEMTRILRQYGYEFLRFARGAHELWKHQNGTTILVTRSGLNDARAKQNWLAGLRRAAA